MKRYKEKDPEAFRAKNNERQKLYARERLSYSQRKAGWTAELTAKKLQEQEGLCDICKIVLVPESRNGFDSLHRDHDHATGKARSLLCHQCNTILGTYEKKIRGRVQSFEDYLKKHESTSLTEQEEEAIIKDS